MHRALLLVAGGLICFSQPALAASGYIQLSKPNTGYYAFMQDRNACLSAASPTGGMRRTAGNSLCSG